MVRVAAVARPAQLLLLLALTLASLASGAAAAKRRKPRPLGAFSRKLPAEVDVGDFLEPPAQFGSDSPTQSPENTDTAHDALDGNGEGEGDVYDRALEALIRGDYGQASSMLCTQKGFRRHGGEGEWWRVGDLEAVEYGDGAVAWDGIGHAPTPLEEAGGRRWVEEGIQESRRKAYAVLRVCGFVAMSGVFPRSLVKELHDEADEHFDRHLASLSRKRAVANEAASSQRSDGRHEVKNPMNGTFTDPRLIVRPAVMRVVQDAMATDKLEIDTFSVVTSLPRTPAQFWHRDLDQPFKQHEQLSDTLLPAAGVVMFAPLRDVPIEMGPTALLGGSHLPCHPRDRKEYKIYDYEGGGHYVVDHECPHLLGDTVYADVKAGNALLFDIRTMHRGSENRSPNRRPQLYLTYFAEFFDDAVNFIRRQVPEQGNIPPPMRKLLTRVAEEEYVRRLEARLTDLGEDIRPLRYVVQDKDENQYRMMPWWGGVTANLQFFDKVDQLPAGGE